MEDVAMVGGEGWGFGGRIPGGEGAGEIKKKSGVSWMEVLPRPLWSRTRSLRRIGSPLWQRAAPGCLVFPGLAIVTPDLRTLTNASSVLTGGPTGSFLCCNGPRCAWAPRTYAMSYPIAADTKGDTSGT